MVLASLREALRLVIAIPVLWVTGLATGTIGSTWILVMYYGGAFIAGRVAVLLLILLPLFLAGSLGTIRTGDGSFPAFLSSARHGYFQVLLPFAVVLAAAFLTLFVVMIPASLLSGGAMAAAGLVIPGVLIPFAFFTCFSAAAAVMEDRKVLDSIRRSVEFTLRHSMKTLLFFLANLAILFGALILALLAWSILLAEQLAPLTLMNATELAVLTPSDLAGIVGTGGIWIAAAVAFVLLTCCSTFLVASYACFFRRLAGASPPAPVQGEFDAKGRWYRY
jgi:hypothetical protein